MITLRIEIWERSIISTFLKERKSYLSLSLILEFSYLQKLCVPAIFAFCKKRRRWLACLFFLGTMFQFYDPKFVEEKTFGGHSEFSLSRRYLDSREKQIHRLTSLGGGGVTPSTRQMSRDVMRMKEQGYTFRPTYPFAGN